LSNNPQNNFTFRKVLYYEKVTEAKVHELITTAMQNNQNFCDLRVEETEDAIQKSNEIKIILETNDKTMEQKIESIAGRFALSDKKLLKDEIERKPINHVNQEEEEVELEEIEVKRWGCRVDDNSRLKRTIGRSCDYNWL